MGLPVAGRSGGGMNVLGSELVVGRSKHMITIAQLVAASVGASSPAWDRLAEITKERMAGG
jgi:hypothetical protein